jgi:hypothetical protein
MPIKKLIMPNAFKNVTHENYNRSEQKTIPKIDSCILTIV